MEISRVAAHTVAGVDIGGTKVTFILWSSGAIAYRMVLPYAAGSSREFSELVLKGMGDLRLRAKDAGTKVTFILWSSGAIAYRMVLPYAAGSSREFSELVLKGMGDLRLRAKDAG